MRPVAWFVLSGLCLAGATVSAQPEATAVFSEANEHFRQANDLRASDPDAAAELYRRAARRYETLVRELGIRNSKLYYNLGNAYFQLGDVGRAILNYLVAQRLDPADANVARNLEFARASRTDMLEPAGGSGALDTLLFWHYGFSSPTRLRVLAVAWITFWGLLLLRRAGKDWVPREIALGAGAVVVLLTGSLAWDMLADSRTEQGVVVAAESVARQGDGQSYAPAFEDALHAGVEFRVLEERPGWHRVELPDGRRCWLADEDIELVH